MLKYQKIRDHYFGAWIISIYKRDYKVRGNYLLINISKDEYIQFLDEYEAIKPILKKIRSLVKEFNTTQSIQV